MKKRKLLIASGVVLVMTLLVASPFIANSVTRRQYAETFDNFRSLHLAIQTMEMDRIASGADIESDVELALIEGNYLSKSDLDTLTDGYTMEYFPLAEEPPPSETPIIIAIGNDRKVVVTYGGEMRVEWLNK